MDRPAVSQALRGLLPHVGNPAYLERQPCARTLVPGEAAPRGDRVRRALLDLIEELRPLRSSSPGDAEWRQYRQLVLRYVEGQGRDQIAAAMGVSTRQASRDHEHAIEGLVDLVLTRRSSQPESGDRASDPGVDPGADLLREAASVAAPGRGDDRRRARRSRRSSRRWRRPGRRAASACARWCRTRCRGSRSAARCCARRS